jgi:hypothetical protein
MAKLPLAVLIALLLACPARACLSGADDFAAGSTTDMAMALISGQGCAIAFTGARSLTAIRGIRMTTPAKHGRAGVWGSGVAYQSKSGFKGEDFFAFTVSGDWGTQAGTATVRVRVTVQ